MVSNLTSRNRENIQKLIDGLKALPDGYDGFSMTDFVTEGNVLDIAQLEKGEHVCGSVGCIIGHGPSFGIPMWPSHIDFGRNRVNWSDYSMDMFGINDTYIPLGGTDTEWSFCFSPRWSNSIEQAIRRLEMVLRGEIPQGWLYRDRYDADGKLIVKK